MQFQVINSPFSEEQAELLNQLVTSLTEEQRIWLSGYFASPSAAAIVNQGVTASTGRQQAAEGETRSITVLYGSHTGNCQALAEQLTDRLKTSHEKVSLFSLDDFKPKSLKNVEDLLLLTSTHGDGDPPDNALSFYDYVFSKRAPNLKGVRFSVLSLGDSSYEFFCQTGKDFDKRLEELGAERLYERVDCDLDYEEFADVWMEGIVEKVNKLPDGGILPAEAVEQKTDTPAYSKSNPFQAEILENINLNGRGSNKETRHVELDLEGSQLAFEPGDSLGIFPQNDPVLVNMIIEEMQWNPDETVPINKDGEIRSVREALSSAFEITTLTKPLLEKAAAFSSQDGLLDLLEDTSKWKAYIEGRDLLDLLKDFGPWKATVQEFAGILRKIPVRLYSIASSLKAFPDEVHLTIGTVRYEAHGRNRSGVCSIQCAERSEAGDTLSVFVQKNANFKLPKDDSAPMIMIGAGTGVAPYRSFLEEREETEAEGETWLFFGDQHFGTDFLYQTEWQGWLKDGTLSRIDLAFSRDTTEKVYVQHKMKEKSADLFQWIKNGAYLYVCGDEKQMAKDVERTLLDIFQTEGNLSESEAKDYLTDLRKNKRYQRDVY